MKPSSPAQLARLLDQLQASYPNGIPRNVIKACEAPESGAQVDTTPPYLLVAVSAQGSLTTAEDELIDSIAIKGLKLSRDQFAKLVVSEEASVNDALGSSASVVIVFGGSQSRGLREREGGGRGLFTFSVADLLADAAHKKELWRELQKLL
jgi:hypothetical protein